MLSRAPVSRLLWPLLAACLAGGCPSDPPEFSTGDDDDDDDTSRTPKPGDDDDATGPGDDDATDPGDDDDDTGPLAEPWSDPGFWTEPGPLDGILFPTTFPTEANHWEVRVATSSDRVSWSSDGRVIATAFSSLNIFVTDGGVIIVGMVDYGLAYQYGVEPPTGPSVDALVSADLEHWTTRSWPVQDPAGDFLVDPALYRDEDGSLKAVYFSHNSPGMDPVYIPGPHSLRSAVWSNGFVEESKALFAYEYAADPVLCLMENEHWLFFTHKAEDIRAAKRDPGGTFSYASDFLWGYTVPFCRNEGDGLELLAQNDNGEKGPPVARLSTDGELDETGRLYKSPPVGEPCTSPVVEKFGDLWIMACAIDAKPQ